MSADIHGYEEKALKKVISSGFYMGNGAFLTPIPLNTCFPVTKVLSVCCISHPLMQDVSRIVSYIFCGLSTDYLRTVPRTFHRTSFFDFNRAEDELCFSVDEIIASNTVKLCLHAEYTIG